MAEKNEFQTKIIDIDGVKFEGYVSSVSSVNDSGPFDILKNHANFITLISKEIVLKVGRNEKRLVITKGALICEGNSVKIYLGL